MLEFIILMVILDLLMKWQFGEKVSVEEPQEKQKPKAYVMGNTAEWEFESLDDAMEYREWRLAGNRGNALDFYKEREED